jgi:hypothetical protein
MSQQPEPEEGRAADAFRSALSRHADEVTADVALPSRPARRPGRWVAAGAALAVAASAVVGFALVDRDRGSDGGLDPAGEPPAIAEGWRGVTFRDVTVQVPEEWGDAAAPQSDWCVGSPSNPLGAPYVDTRLGFGGVLDIGCEEQRGLPAGFGPDPVEQWVPHLKMYDTATLVDPVPDGSTTYEGWTMRVRTLGDVQVRLLTDASTEDVADEVLASAEQTEVGALGCETTSPAQEPVLPDDPASPPAGDLASLDRDEVRGLLVCQYDRLGTDRPGLRAERTLGTSLAQAWLAGVQQAPRSGGPDAPQNCLDPWESQEVLVVHPLGRDGERLATAYLTYDACAGNGLRDAETTYELTGDDCTPLFGDRITFGSGQSVVYGMCTTPVF